MILHLISRLSLDALLFGAALLVRILSVEESMSQELVMEQDKIKSLTERVGSYVFSHVNLLF